MTLPPDFPALVEGIVGTRVGAARSRLAAGIRHRRAEEGPARRSRRLSGQHARDRRHRPRCAIGIRAARRRAAPAPATRAAPCLSRGGIVLSLERLNRILEIDEQNLLAVVEPNVITGDLQDAVERVGLFYPPDPASLRQSVIGGNVAECAGGPRAFKYGTTKRYVLGLEAVLPTGEIIRTGGKTVKNVVGYDLTQLLVGSEGTLAIITEIILRLVPKPPVQVDAARDCFTHVSRQPWRVVDSH